MFPFDRPNNYNEMLNKIGIFTFVESLGLTWLIAHFVPSVASILSSVKLPVKLDSIEIPFLYVVPAVILALSARIVRLHDKISDVFAVRRTFDVYRVLIPLAGAVGYPIGPSRRQALKANRKPAMQKTFYAYASFEEPKISKALVLSAIDVWTWYWILAELLFLLSLAVVVLLFYREYAPAAYALVATCALIVLFCSCFAVCGSKADHQIEEIVSDSSRVESIRKAFDDFLPGSL